MPKITVRGMVMIIRTLRFRMLLKFKAKASKSWAKTSSLSGRTSKWRVPALPATIMNQTKWRVRARPQTTKHRWCRAFQSSPSSPSSRTLSLRRMLRLTAPKPTARSPSSRSLSCKKRTPRHPPSSGGRTLTKRARQSLGWRSRRFLRPMNSSNSLQAIRCCSKRPRSSSRASCRGKGQRRSRQQGRGRTPCQKHNHKSPSRRIGKRLAYWTNRTSVKHPKSLRSRKDAKVSTTSWASGRRRGHLSWSEQHHHPTSIVQQLTQEF